MAVGNILYTTVAIGLVLWARGGSRTVVDPRPSGREPANKSGKQRLAARELANKSGKQRLAVSQSFGDQFYGVADGEARGCEVHGTSRVGAHHQVGT